jgi:hypothetical protein
MLRSEEDSKSLKPKGYSDKSFMVSLIVIAGQYCIEISSLITFYWIMMVKLRYVTLVSVE